MSDSSSASSNFTALGNYLDSLFETYGVPGSDLVVYHGHEPVYRHMSGFSDAGRTVPTSENNLYWIYSATKVITCTAVLQLIEQGKIGLFDPLGKYLPEFAEMRVSEDLTPGPGGMRVNETGPSRPAKNAIRIADLFSMQAGMSYNLQTPAIERIKAETGGKATTRQIVRALSESPLAYEPSERWMYSLAHDVLAAVVEVVSGQKFSVYLKEHVFDPLGMRDVTFKLSPAQKERLAALYRYDMKTRAFTNIPGDNMFDASEAYESGGAGIACTVDAYGLFVDAMSNYGVGKSGARILTKESIELMRENRLTGAALEDFKKAGKEGYGYGLGVRTLIDKSKSKSPLKEFGWDGAAGAYVVIDPENKIGVFLAMHTLMFVPVYFEIHPKIRDLIYTAMGLDS